MDFEAVWREQAVRAGDFALRVPMTVMPSSYPQDEHRFTMIEQWSSVDALVPEVKQRGTISRPDLFDLASRARAGQSITWTDVFVASYAWGYARTPLGPARIKKILSANRGRVEPTLARAIEHLDAGGPLPAYFMLRNAVDAAGVGHLKGLGPAFFTKFLYFARPGGAGVQPLILDQLLAGAVRRLCSDKALLVGSTWTTTDYAFYLAFMHALADRAESDSWRRPPAGCSADALERALFNAELEHRSAGSKV